jgi:hypothetical protein
MNAPNFLETLAARMHADSRFSNTRQQLELHSDPDTGAAFSLDFHGVGELTSDECLAICMPMDAGPLQAWMALLKEQGLTMFATVTLFASEDGTDQLELMGPENSGPEVAIDKVLWFIKVSKA